MRKMIMLGGGVLKSAAAAGTVAVMLSFAIPAYGGSGQDVKAEGAEVKTQEESVKKPKSKADHLATRKKARKAAAMEKKAGTCTDMSPECIAKCKEMAAKCKEMSPECAAKCAEMAAKCAEKKADCAVKAE